MLQVNALAFPLLTPTAPRSPLQAAGTAIVGHSTSARKNASLCLLLLLLLRLPQVPHSAAASC